ncbi:unnamed protein product [Oikopleura dioica]|uniref:Sulfotransferase n=1 Tax=Oikopleura dioica TaxID=34765 RepID=E4Y4Q7_OIKDI|nr:unnamed protein product [Oikopleura dioica]
MFRSKHRRLCAPPFCAKDLSNQLVKCNSACGLVDTSLASRVCKKLIPAIKSIRFMEIEGLENMAKRNNLDLKIIFLARDPRGIYSSRMKIYDKQISRGDIENRTRRRRGRGDHAFRFQSPWLNKQSLVVKYEDLALNPEDISKEILEFSGLNFSDSVSNWIKSNTVSRTNKSDAFGTERNSKNTAFAWQNDLDKSSIEDIQSFCTRSMRILEYEPL